MQESAYNTPFQFSNIEGSATHTPEHADHGTHQLMDGDIIIIATDGLYDNVATDEIISIVSKGCPDADQAAVNLVSRARWHMGDKTQETPWSRRASQHKGKDVIGGKRDDIACIVGHVNILS